MTNPKRIRAKFQCNTITQTMGGRHREIQGEQKYVPEPVYTIEMAPVYESDAGKNAENKKFWDASPSGKLELQCVLKEVIEHFEVGKYYYLDIVEAPEDATKL